jgi:hypothetical protein
MMDLLLSALTSPASGCVPVNIARKRFRHYLNKRFLLPWFPDAREEAFFEGPALVSVANTICGYGYDWNLPAVTMSMDCPSRLTTIHTRHIEIHQDERRLALNG